VGAVKLGASRQRDLAGRDQSERDGLALLGHDRLAVEIELDRVSRRREATCHRDDDSSLSSERRTPSIRAPGLSLLRANCVLTWSANMRFAVLGPANDDLLALEKAASLTLFELEADPVIYLGPDDALDRLVIDWARRLVGPDPSEDGLWSRAAERCCAASPEEIDRFISAERRRERLKALRCLPAATSRTIEILEGRVASPRPGFSTGTLSALLFGKSKEPSGRSVPARSSRLASSGAGLGASLFCPTIRAET
jgi:hypothetical protein